MTGPVTGPVVVTLSSPDAATRAAVLDLAGRASACDGVSPLSEASRIALARTGGARTHLLVAAPLGPTTGVVGYAQLAGDGSAELVVDPAHRRRGIGTALLRALLDAGHAEHAETVRVWAHGNLRSARALAAGAGLSPVRELHLMARPLGDEDRVPPPLPQGFSVRTFRPGADEQAWVELNGAAFADHPEQGSLTVTDLRERIAQPWFDPEGFFLLEDEQAGPADPPMAGFHWTKVERAQDTPPFGEVYVVGVHPAYQGRGLAGPLTGLGLAHLAGLGLPEVRLYVDGDNTAALATYRRAGFTDLSVDVMYAARSATPGRADPHASVAGPCRASQTGFREGSGQVHD